MHSNEACARLFTQYNASKAKLVPDSVYRHAVMQGRVLIRQVQLLDELHAGLQVCAAVQRDLSQKLEGCQTAGWGAAAGDQCSTQLRWRDFTQAAIGNLHMCFWEQIFCSNTSMLEHNSQLGC